MNNVVVYCSMMSNKLPTKNHGQIDYDAAKEFDALVSIPDTRKRTADKIVTEGSKNEHITKKPFRIGTRCSSRNKAIARAPIMVSPVTTEKTGGRTTTRETAVDTETTNVVSTINLEKMVYWTSGKALAWFGLIDPKHEEDNEGLCFSKLFSFYAS